MVTIEVKDTDPILGVATEKVDLSRMESFLAEMEGRWPVVVFLNGPKTGHLVALDRRGLVCGRDSSCDIVVPDGTVSRLHAKILVDDSGGVVLEDVGSRNGTLVNGDRISRHVLADGDRIVMGRTVLKFLTHGRVEKDYQRRVYEMSTRDTLTVAFNRRYFDERIVSEVAYCRRHGAYLALLMLDVDGFKALNDSYGHRAGDRVLVEIADLVRRSIRAEDVFARYGGDEFVLIVRGIPPAGVEALAERLRASVERLSIRHDDRRIAVSVSVGAATVRGHRECDGHALLEAADRCLYEAKAAGKNRVLSTVLEERRAAG